MPGLRFDQRLVLNQWMLSLFGASSFEELAKPLKNAGLEGYDEENVSRFHRELTARLAERKGLPDDLLLAYDRNVVRHWQAIVVRRGQSSQRLSMKYFQYLALLFTEVYLDRYFSAREKLLADLNVYVDRFNRGEAGPERNGRPRLTVDQATRFEPDQLNKLAFWAATGSGKTLLMHVNVAQYRHYLDKHKLSLPVGERELDHVVLLTPNEGLSRQHLEELTLSGIPAELFSKEGRGLFAGQSVEILDVNKLREDSGEKTIAVDAFEGNNLVLVDEGHRGAGGTEWMDKRNRLCEKGFSFEYSATFGQAMKAANRPALTQEYTRCILFDYSYRFFYLDGYGKDYEILNLEDDSQEDVRRLYLTACLLVFYQQTRIYLDKRAALGPYLVDHPLWVFVGSTVTKTVSKREVTDIVDILLFLAGFVEDRVATVDRIGRLLQGKDGLHDGGGRRIFENSFTYLAQLGLTPEQVFADALRVIFNASARASLHVENLKGVEGELALRLGDNEPFGVINVGDSSALAKECEKRSELVTTTREISGSLFQALSAGSSTVNLLVGSKKFTEGWNSWRVSTMGLMNVGRSEGSEIIQLFGRGVRLRGLGFGLKRSSRIEGIQPPEHLTELGTLDVFGVRADYMRQFREYLVEEGLPATKERVEFVLPVTSHPWSPDLRTIRLKKGLDFRKSGPKPTAGLVFSELKLHPVVLDWYPRLQVEVSRDIQQLGPRAAKNDGKLKRQHLAFLDWDEIYFELERLKSERGWHNLSLPREAARELLESPDWYTLYIPEDELRYRGFERVRVWQEIALALLQKYLDRFYKHCRSDWEKDFLEYRALDSADADIIREYRFLIEKSQQELVEKLKQLKALIESGGLKTASLAALSTGSFEAVAFGRHLYEPLAYLKSGLVEVRPVALNEGERDFVVDLRRFFEKDQDYFAGKELYLLRNLSRGRGVGFFEAGNFYPDFILWLLTSDRQYVTFVDPKGIRNLQGLNDPKIRFHRTVKDIEARLGDSGVILNSFILSNTPLAMVGWWSEGLTEADFEIRHVLFQKERRDTYIRTMLDRVLATPG